MTALTPKTILFITPAAHIGGAEVGLLTMCRELQQRNITPVVIVPPKGPLEQALQALHVKTVPLSWQNIQSGQIFVVLWNCLKLRWKLRHIAIDIIHANSVFSLYLSVYLGLIMKKPVCIHWADFIARKGDIQLLNLAKHRVTIFAVSRAVQTYLAGQGIAEQQLRLLHFGSAVPPAPAMDKTAFLSRYHIPPDHLIVGITGRIDDWKGHRYALRALAKLKDTPIVLVIMGDFHLTINPALERELKELISQYSLEKKVIFTGFIKNPSDCLFHLDIVIAPSDYEPFGLVALEAMATKKPIIATAGSGFNDTIIHGETGYLIPPKDPDSLAERIRHLALQPALRQQMGQKGYERLRREFSIEKFITALTSYYAEFK